MKTSITQSEYLQLLGLITLGKHHSDMLDNLIKAASSITGEDDEHGHGHSCDMISGFRNLDDGLRIMGITVLEDTK